MGPVMPPAPIMPVAPEGLISTSEQMVNIYIPIKTKFNCNSNAFANVTQCLTGQHQECVTVYSAIYLFETHSQQ